MANINRFYLLPILLLAAACPSSAPVRTSSIEDGGTIDARLSSSGGAGGSSTSSLSSSSSGYGTAPEQAAPFDLGYPSAFSPYYHGGLVMHNPIHIYLLWYGDHTDQAKTIVSDMVSSIGGSSWWGINTEYYQYPTITPITPTFDPVHEMKFVSSDISLVKQVDLGYSQGTMLTDDMVISLISLQITTGALPLDPDGQYFFLASADIQETSGFDSYCNVFCGYHGEFPLNGQTLKYAFTENSDQCVTECSVRGQYEYWEYKNSPNDNFGMDDMVSVIAHEMSEIANDPYPFDNIAWQDWQGNESSDQCSWVFGKVFDTNNGSAANVHWGARDYLVQKNWLLSLGGCAISR
jgi:hypothetical protein